VDNHDASTRFISDETITAMKSDRIMLPDSDERPLSLYTDGASRRKSGEPKGPAAIAYAIYDLTGKIIEKDSKCIGIHTNNEAEYEAILWGIEKVRERRCSALRVFSDSELVVRQFTGEYGANDERMAQYARRVAANRQLFGSFEVVSVPRENPRIKLVDSMVNEALDRLCE